MENTAIMKGTNIEEKLIRERDRFISGEELLQDFKTILAEDTKKEDAIKERLLADHSGENNGFNAFDLDLLETENIFHIDQIKKVSVIYRLRFLDSHYFKKELPREAIQKTKHLEKLHGIELSGFKIMAPAKSFRLKNADDPLLFAPMGNGYYYLIHKWGKDLSPWRKLRSWPFRGIEHMIATVLAFSLLIAAVFPWHLLTRDMDFSKYAIFAFILFQWVGGFTLFYCVKTGKNFSPSIWRSIYFNA